MLNVHALENELQVCSECKLRFHAQHMPSYWERKTRHVFSKQRQWLLTAGRGNPESIPIEVDHDHSAFINWRHSTGGVWGRLSGNPICHRTKLLIISSGQHPGHVAHSPAAYIRRTRPNHHLRRLCRSGLNLGRLIFPTNTNRSSKQARSNTKPICLYFGLQQRNACKRARMSISLMTLFRKMSRYLERWDASPSPVIWMLGLGTL